ncbi:MAG: FGGY family carbohydrate kinase [Deltaproteobacteria bacterium]
MPETPTEPVSRGPSGGGATLPMVLAIDLGTTNLKVGLVRLDGTVAAGTTRPIETLLPPGGGSEQDPDAIWRAVLDGAAEVVRRAEAGPDDIVALLASSQFFSLLPVDQEGRALANMQLWSSNLGAAHSERLLADNEDAFLQLLSIHGAVPFGNDSLSHALHFREDRPEVWEKTHALLEPVDFLTLRLTDICTTNLCTAFPLLLTDNRDLARGDWSDELLEIAGIPRDKLAPMVPVDAQVGVVLPEVAATLGLAAGTPVFSGLNDTQAVTVATGTFRPGFGGVNIGTTIQVLGRAVRKDTDFESMTVSMPSPFPGEYLAMGECGLGGRLVEHFLRNFVYADDAFGEHGVDDIFAALEQTVAGEPAGAGHLLYLPWLTGTMAPLANSATRGGFLNMSLGTTRARMARALLEGVAYQLRWMFPFVERFSGSEVTDLTFSGGGARSATWAATLADVLNRPVRRLADPGLANVRGVAFLAFFRLGLVDASEIDRFRPTAEIHDPDPTRQKLYDGLYDAWRKAYDANLPIFEALQNLEK